MNVIKRNAIKSCGSGGRAVVALTKAQLSAAAPVLTCAIDNGGEVDARKVGIGTIALATWIEVVHTNPWIGIATAHPHTISS